MPSLHVVSLSISIFHVIYSNNPCHIRHWADGMDKLEITFCDLKPARVGVSLSYPRRLMRASAGSFENASSTRMLARSRSATFDVGALPICSHTTIVILRYERVPVIAGEGPDGLV